MHSRFLVKLALNKKSGPTSEWLRQFIAQTFPNSWKRLSSTGRLFNPALETTSTAPIFRLLANYKPVDVGTIMRTAKRYGVGTPGGRPVPKSSINIIPEQKENFIRELNRRVDTQQLGLKERGMPKNIPMGFKQLNLRPTEIWPARRLMTENAKENIATMNKNRKLYDRDFLLDPQASSALPDFSDPLAIASSAAPTEDLKAYTSLLRR